MGNTILHEIATFDRVDSAAKVILNREPDLLGMCNKCGETALFRTVQYGKAVMFDFLDQQVNQFFDVNEREACYYKLGGATILQAAVRSEHFGLALSIAIKYDYLVNERDADGMTALQLLACNRQAFGSGESIVISRDPFILVFQLNITLQRGKVKLYIPYIRTLEHRPSFVWVSRGIHHSIGGSKMGSVGSNVPLLFAKFMYICKRKKKLKHYM